MAGDGGIGTTIAGRELTELVAADHAGDRFVDCTLRGLDLEEAALRSLDLDGCDLVDCTLRLADLTDTRFADCRFLRCDLMAVDWTRTRWDTLALHPPVRFAYCRLDYATFHGLSLVGATLYACSARDVDLGEADLTRADLRFSDLTNASFHRTRLDEADLVGATGYAFDLTTTRARGCRVALPEAGALLEQQGLRVDDVPGDPLPADAVFEER